MEKNRKQQEGMKGRMQRMLKFMVWCLHVRHKPVFYQNGWNNHAVIFTVMAPFGLSITLLWPCVDVPRLCSPVSFASVVLRMRQMYDVLLEEAFVFLMRKKQADFICSPCSECCLFEGREASLSSTHRLSRLPISRHSF